MINGFKNFLLRGNVVDLAVAVIIGAAFGDIVKALVDGILNPLIAAIFGKPDISGVGNFSLNGADFSVGSVLQAILNFIFVAAAIYFVIVVPMQKVMSMRKKADEEAPAAVESNEVVLLTEIRDALRAQAGQAPGHQPSA